MIDQATGESLMRWTVRIAVACYVVRIWTLFARPRPQIPTRGECFVWSIAWACYFAHVLLAFHYAHQWSHVDAFEHTALETERLTGVKRGEGVWVNYVFTLVWLVDVVRLWVARTRGRETSLRWDIALHAFFAFIVFNATVVFGQNVYRWLAIPVAIVTLWFWWRSRTER